MLLESCCSHFDTAPSELIVSSILDIHGRSNDRLQLQLLFTVLFIPCVLNDRLI